MTDAAESPAMFQVRARILRDIPYCNLSLRHPDSVIHVWCNFERDIVETESPTAEKAAALRKDMEETLGPTLHRLEAQADRHLQAFGDACSHDYPAGVTRIIEGHDGLRYEPLTFRGGWQHFSFLTVVPDRIQDTLEALAVVGELEVLSKSRLESPLVSQTIIVPVETLFAGLTAKQASALNAAVAQGFYEIPRRSTVKDVAATLGVPRTTYEQHLRKAENKVMRAVAPYMRLIRQPDAAATADGSAKSRTRRQRTERDQEDAR